MAGTRIKSYIERLITYEKCPHKLALTCALGVFIGISPFAGFHTLMTFACAWLFSINLAALFAVSVLIHNPWTTVPVYVMDHIFGTWLFSLLDIDCMQFDPAWVASCNMYLKEYIGVAGFSLSAFVMGGTLLAVSGGIIMYPLSKHLFSRYLSEK